jgi:TatD DNase family protein
MIIDTHAHIYVEEFDEDVHEMLSRAFNSGVDHIVMPNIDTTSIEPMRILAERYPSCHMTMGLHPCYVKEDYNTQLDKIRRALDNFPCVGVGEIGIDLYWDQTFVKEQQIAFETQIEWSRERRLPIIIHSRDSLDLTIDTVKKLQKGDLTGIFHCFNGTIEQASRIIDLGFMMGAGGVITYKNAALDTVFPHIPLHHLVLETDAPYLSPVPHRGKRNEVAHITHIAQRLADIMSIDLLELCKVTSANATKMFRLN